MGVPRFLDDPVWRHRGNPVYADHDPRGFQNERDLVESRYLVTGSSHVYGTNLKREDTWPIRLQRSGVELYSAALGAWSLMQYWRVAQHYLSPNIEHFFVCV